MSYTQDEMRILNIEGAIIGGWSSDKVNYVFLSTPSMGERGKVTVLPNILQGSTTEYKITIESGDPYITFYTLTQSGEQTTKYKIESISTKNKKLILTNDVSGRIILGKNMAQF